MIREYLTRNKIFFETIAAVSLTVMSIIISWNSYQVSAAQLAIERAKLKPIFSVDHGNSLGVGGAWVDTYELENYGNKARDIKVEECTVLYFSRYRNPDVVVYAAPILGYLHAREGVPKLWAAETHPKTTWALLDALKFLSEEDALAGRRPLDWRLDTVLRVEYFDVLGERRVEFVRYRTDQRRSPQEVCEDKQTNSANAILLDRTDASTLRKQWADKLKAYSIPLHR